MARSDSVNRSHAFSKQVTTEQGIRRINDPWQDLAEADDSDYSSESTIEHNTFEIDVQYMELTETIHHSIGEGRTVPVEH